MDTKIEDLTNYTTPLDADNLVVDDTAGGETKRTTWANIKATLKTYFDTLYAPVLGADDNYVTDAEKVVIGNTSGTNSGNETTSTLGATINGASAATPNDTDLVATVESSVVKKITWTNVKAFLKTYFDTLYLALAGGTMTGNITLGENTSLDIDPSLSADGKYSGVCVTGTSGEALSFGDVVTLADSSGKWFKADVSGAVDADTDARNLLGMCVLAAGGADASTKVLLVGNIKADANFPALTVGKPVYASTTGDITQTQPTTTDHVIRILGYPVPDATSSTAPQSIYFNPDNTWTTHT